MFDVLVIGGGATAVGMAVYGWMLARAELRDCKRAFAASSALYRDMIAQRDTALVDRDFDVEALTAEIAAYEDAARLRHNRLSEWGKAGRAKQLAARGISA